MGGGDDVGVDREAQVVVGGEGHHPAAVLGEDALGPPGVEGEGTAPAALGVQARRAGLDE